MIQGRKSVVPLRGRSVAIREIERSPTPRPKLRGLGDFGHAPRANRAEVLWSDPLTRSGHGAMLRHVESTHVESFLELT